MSIKSIGSCLCCCFYPSKQEDEPSLEKKHKVLERSLGRSDSSIIESARIERANALKSFNERAFNELVEEK